MAIGLRLAVPQLRDPMGTTPGELRVVPSGAHQLQDERRVTMTAAKRTKKAPKKRDNVMRRRQEGILLAKLSMVHHYAFLQKPKINMVMNFKTREVTPHLEYRIVVPADSELARLIPFKGKNEYIAKAREDKQ
jgi:hypothetical protein